MVTQEQLLEAALAKAGGNKRRLSRETGLDYDYVLRWTAPGGTGLLLTLVTFGFWLIAWLGLGILAGVKRRMVTVDEFGNVVQQKL